MAEKRARLEASETKPSLRTSGVVKCTLFILSLYSFVLTISFLVACIHFRNELSNLRQQLPLNSEVERAQGTAQQASTHITASTGDDEVLSFREYDAYDYSINPFSNLDMFMDDLDDRKLRGEYDGNIKVINKREVISPSKGYLTLQTMVADAVKNEFSELISGQPSSAGAVYIRWGKRSCPSSAKLVYRGIAAGTFWTSPGGGTNYQCLAEDPEYGTKISQSIKSYIGGVIYKFHGSQGVKQQSLHDSLVPCVACEADRRQSKIMIPGKIRCPADWTVEYIGYLVSEATVWSDHHRSTFECLDSSPESAPNSSTMQEAALFHHVSAQCSGKGGLNYCPPYQEKRELSCVVCTK